MKKTLVYLFFLSLLSSLLYADLASQYESAYRLARDKEALNFSDATAQAWSEGFLLKKAVFSGIGLLAQYEEASQFALAEEGLRLSLEEADQWAKKLLILRGQIGADASLRDELNRFLEEVFLEEEEALEWSLEFFQSDAPLYSRQGLLERYTDVYSFARENIFFSFTHEEALKLAKDFIGQRFYFQPGIPLLSQYVLAYNFAFSSEGLRMTDEEARAWAEEFVLSRGALNPSQNLENQFQDAENFAFATGGLEKNRNEARDWAVVYIQKKGLPDISINLFRQYREAYFFAYNGQVLSLIRKVRDAPPGVFLSDEAMKWSQKFIAQRSEIKGEEDLLEKYFQALNFAYSSEGLKLEIEAARAWAIGFLEKEEVR